MRGLTDKGVLVTGGSSGIGKATVARFLQEGSRVHFCGIDPAEVDGSADGAVPARRRDGHGLRRRRRGERG